MVISYQWLSGYLPRPLPVEELSRILTSIGLEVEAVEKKEAIKGGLEGLVIGEVLRCTQHPNADKLKLTTVSIGGPEALNIVCGAPNVAAGQRVVVAPVGTMVHPVNGEAFEIKKAKIRGEASEGMLCAEDEIGLGESHAGIMVLPADAPIGRPAKAYFGIGEADYAIHIGLTPNRSDAASHIGVARDVCAYLTHHSGEKEVPAIPENIRLAAEGDSLVSVHIEAPDGCPRYMGITLEGIAVGPSPEWLRQRLSTIGIRSINNVVDATNYVLHEWGQPLHAFDADKLRGGKIVVRFAEEGEKFITLDSKERSLRGADLMICDAEGPVAMAGVFGGLESGVTDATTRIFIESAYFDPATIRRTSLHHSLRTDAATHFEKGVDMEVLEPALMRAAALITELSGGIVKGGAVDEYPAPLTPVTFRVEYDLINRLSGKAYMHGAVDNILEGLGFKIGLRDADGMMLTVPSSKHDVSGPADVMEEIMRIDGLDEIAIPERLNISLLPARPSDRNMREKAAEVLVGAGFSEIVTNSITSSKYYPDRPDVVKMLNSLSADLDAMRPTMLETGLEVVSYNLARRNKNLLLFELGNVYWYRGVGDYFQRARLQLFATGDAVEATYKTAGIKADAAFLKSAIQNLLVAFGIARVSVSHTQDKISYLWKGKPLGTVEEVPYPKLQAFDIKERVWTAELDWNMFKEATGRSSITFAEVPRFPAVQRDLALVLDKNVTYAQVQSATDGLKLPSLQSYHLFDVYEGDKLGAGKKSMALSYTFQLADRTLTDAETEVLVQQLTIAYAKELGAQIRG